MAIQLIYELKAPPGHLAEIHRLFEHDYLPGALERGMTFHGSYITPPIELDDAPTTLVLQFSLPDENAVWAMKRKVNETTTATDFWRTIDTIVESRTRRFLSPFDPVAFVAHIALGHVAVVEGHYDEGASHYALSLIHI